MFTFVIVLNNNTDDVEVIQFRGLSQYNQFSWDTLFLQIEQRKRTFFFFFGLTSNTLKSSKTLSFALRSF